MLLFRIPAAKPGQLVCIPHIFVVVYHRFAGKSSGNCKFVAVSFMWRAVAPAFPVSPCGIQCRKGCLCPAVSGSPCHPGTCGGLAPALSALLCLRANRLPHPPAPLPLRGRGRLRVFLCKGLRPLQPRACAGSYTASRKATETRASPGVSLGYCKPPGMQCFVRRRVGAPGRSPEAAPRGFSCRGAGGEAPGRIN